MSILIEDLEAADLIGGYYCPKDETSKKIRIRKLIRSAGIQFLQKGKEVYIDKAQLPKLMEAIKWQSNPIKETIRPTGRYAERPNASRARQNSVCLQEYLTAAK